jgi:hypothetical protein
MYILVSYWHVFFDVFEHCVCVLVIGMSPFDVYQYYDFFFLMFISIIIFS